MVLGRIASILAAEACTLTGQTETASFRWEQLVKIFLAWIRCLRNIRNWCDTSRNHATLKMDTLCTVEEKEVEMITSNFQPFTFKCAGLHELCLFEASIQIPVHMYVIEKTPAQFENVESNFDHFHLYSWIPSCHPSSIPIAFSYHGPSHCIVLQLAIPNMNQTASLGCHLPRLPGVMLHLHDCRLSIMTLCHLCVSNTRATPGLVKKSWFVAKILQVWATEDIDIVIQICKYIHSIYNYIYVWLYNYICMYTYGHSPRYDITRWSTAELNSLISFQLKQPSSMGGDPTYGWSKNQQSMWGCVDIHPPNENFN